MLNSQSIREFVDSPGRGLDLTAIEKSKAHELVTIGEQMLIVRAPKADRRFCEALLLFIGPWKMKCVSGSPNCAKQSSCPSSRHSYTALVDVRKSVFQPRHRQTGRHGSPTRLARSLISAKFNSAIGYLPARTARRTYPRCIRDHRRRRSNTL